MDRMAPNVASAQGPAGNLEHAKNKRAPRIGGIVALTMGIGRAIVAQMQMMCMPIGRVDLSAAKNLVADKLTKLRARGSPPAPLTSW